MTIENHNLSSLHAAEKAPPLAASRKTRKGYFAWRVTSLTRRIIVLNVAALLILVGGILYLNKFRAGLVEAKVQGLQTQGEIIAGAIAASATTGPDGAVIDLERLFLPRRSRANLPPQDSDEEANQSIDVAAATPILRRLITPTQTRARLYDATGQLLLDSRSLSTREQILTYELPPPEVLEAPSIRNQFLNWLRGALRGNPDLPLYSEFSDINGMNIPEVRAALAGDAISTERVNEQGDLIVSVAVPVQRMLAVQGALVLSTKAGDIDAIIMAEWGAIGRVFLVALGVTILLAVLLAGTIAAPIRRLADAAEQVSRGKKARVEIPDLTSRHDEIGHLSGALRDMTNELYNRLEATESFAADVAHELKNPLSSLQSAVETLDLVRSDQDRLRLSDVIKKDVRRLDRLITDISAASRLDAELARQKTGKIDIAKMLETITDFTNETVVTAGKKVILDMPEGAAGRGAAGRGAAGRAHFMVEGHDTRLGQVIQNLLDNALSFSPENGEVRLSATPGERWIKISVEDDGPGVSPENLERIFERFYTDRPGEENFGNNSGLGLSICRQTITAHGGQIWAENKPVHAKSPQSSKSSGVRFLIELPTAS